MQQLELLLSERTPTRPYCSADLGAGLIIRGRKWALKFPYIQANPPHLRFWMVHDVDKPGAALAWEDAGLPAPAWASTNPETTHAHLAWGLTAPVLTGDGGRDAPLRYLVAVESAYRVALDADPGYSGLITKNPLHPCWRTLYGPPHLYDLAELAEYVDLPKHAPKRGKIEEIGLGRNCSLFDKLRAWAYVEVRQYREPERRNFVIWQSNAYGRALELNGDFVRPLDPRECWHVAVSVAKWTWRKDADARARFSRRQAARGAKGGVRSGEVRRDAAEDKIASARLMRATGHSIRDIAQALQVGKSTVGDWLKVSGEAKIR